MSEVNVSDVVTAYLEVRHKREALQKDYEELDKQFKSEQAQYEAVLLDACNKIDANSINTSHGTVIRKLSERFYCNDWENFYKFVMDNNAPQLLERRIHQSHIKEFLGDGLPPGVNVMREFGITVRKPSSK